MITVENSINQTGKEASVAWTCAESEHYFCDYLSKEQRKSYKQQQDDSYRSIRQQHHDCHIQT